MKKGKILLFTTDFPPSKGGGICTHSHFMVESLRQLSWDFTVLSEYYIPSSKEEIDDYITKNGYNIYKLPESPSFYTLLKKVFFCLKIHRQYKPDIIIGTGRHPSWFAAIVSFLTRTPLVTIGHGTEFTEKTSEKDFKRNKLAYGKSDLLIAISEHTKNVVLGAGIKPKKIEVIHNAANEKNFHKIDPELIKIFIEQKGLSGKKIILTCGSLSERKGQRVIINSLPIVLKEIPNAVYVAVGFPNKKDEFLQLAKELTVDDKVLFPGIIDQNELLLWLNACDLFAMTSVNNNGDYEGFGIAVLEAALCGKTALVSDNGGLKEAVINLKTGIVVKENDVTATANALINLFSNEAKLQTLSDMAYKNTLETGTYSIKGKEYDKVLAELIKK